MYLGGSRLLVTYRNISLATTQLAEELLGRGAPVTVKGVTTREALSRHTLLERPLERYLFVPERNNDVFAQMAEAMWVLAGRNDVAWLERYLPRAPAFSDDGKVWRAAYGPRLRSWMGKDQLDEARRLLVSDRSTRQAVVSLFDPARDFTVSKDIPCSNWIGWIIRDEQLHMNVVLRSNDVMWGFSGANSFEWSVLHEMMAFWVNAAVGPANFFAMSLHLYESHFRRAANIGDAAHGLSPYDYGVKSAPFCTPWSEFGSRIERWFELEADIAAAPDRPLGSVDGLGDPLLDSFLCLAHIRWASEIWDDERLGDELARLPSSDYVLAAYLQFARRRPELLRSVSQGPLAAYLAATMVKSVQSSDLRQAIKRLHAEKDRAYGASWKRRGEFVSILPNIARKVDRFETLSTTSAEMRGEAALDTAIDLVVYVEKYRLFLAQELRPGLLLPPSSPAPLSDHEANLEALIDALQLSFSLRPLEVIISDIVAAFEICWRRGEAGAAAEERFEHATALAAFSAELLAFLVHNDKGSVSSFIRSAANP